MICTDQVIPVLVPVEGQTLTREKMVMGGREIWKEEDNSKAMKY